MDLKHRNFANPGDNAVNAPNVSIVMPCLNETASLRHCVGNALDALALMRTELGLSGEIVVADNGSTDGSQALAAELGARVITVAERGYGAALIGGCRAAYGRYILMGDADGSYNFVEGVTMIARLVEGSDLCMGSRFRGGIAPGAMPWKNRYVGNPALTCVLNLFFRSGVSDAHCGLRAITRQAFERVNLTGSGMEFASEMVIKAALLKLDIAEVPATLSRDLRDRKPHLRPWRDGWRHLRYLFMLSPTWLFGLPASIALLAATLLLFGSALEAFIPGSVRFIGDYWTILAAGAFSIGHLCLIMMIAGQLYALKARYRNETTMTKALRRFLNLETMLAAGGALVATGVTILGIVWVEWVARGYKPADSVFMPVVGTLAMTVGIQNALGGFLLAIISGNESNFLSERRAN
jgi:glycosyltransferase involved in cell wall biosynthesis